MSNFGCPCGCDDCSPSDIDASAIRDWVTAERAKIGTDVTPAIAEIFERCADDLEVGHG